MSISRLTTTWVLPRAMHFTSLLKAGCLGYHRPHGPACDRLMSYASLTDSDSVPEAGCRRPICIPISLLLRFVLRPLTQEVQPAHLHSRICPVPN